jgi:predicted RNase H-like nuclease
MLLEYASLNGHLGPDRPGSYEDSWEAVNEWSKKFLGHGVAQQSFGIWPKIAELDRYMLEKRDPRVHESHPELVFLEMNQGQALGESKRTAAGSEARGELLANHLSRDLDLMSLREFAEGAKGAGIDDLYDSLVLLWTGDRIYSGAASRIPEVVDYDPSGLDMAMWF